MKIKFLGAAGQVTGSSYLLTGGDGSSILVDLGMFQGVADEQKLNAAPLIFDPRKLSAVLLTHAHLDHCGRLPFLTKAGYSGKIYTTEATKIITRISLLDAAKVSHEDNRGTELYSPQDVEETCALLETVSYDVPFTVFGFTITFVDAGHILGSASIKISDKNGSTIVFSGDLGNTPQDLIAPTKYINSADIVVMESTYGGSTHPVEDVFASLQAEINTIEKDQAALVIPAFSIQRTQEILHKIGHLKRDGKIKNKTPVFLDSPMAISVTEVFKDFPNLYNHELSRDESPFDFPGLIFTRTSDESKNILNIGSGKIVIAGGGMMSGGRILHHLKNYLPHAGNRLLIVGYQAAGTLGRAIEEGAKQIKIHGKEVSIAATITKLSSLSSHADQPKLLTWLKHISGVKKVFLVHGEDEPRSILAKKISQELGISDITLPVLNQEVRL